MSRMASSATSTREGAYVYGLRYRWLTPLYDAFIAATMREGRLRPALVRAAGVRRGQRVLDVGCGTGTLTILAKTRCPGADVVGIDGDEEMIARARSKAAAGAVPVAFERALATALPYAPATFDRVLSSLMLHHLSHDQKVLTFAEILRVLRPGGELHVADFGPPVGTYARVAFSLASRIDGVANTADNASGALPHMLARAGFAEVQVGEAIQTAFGTVVLLRARKAGVA